MPSKKRFPSAAVSNTKVEVRNTGGFSEPSLKAGSKPWPIIRVDGLSLWLPMKVGEGLGLRRGVAPLSSSSVGKAGLLYEAPLGPSPNAAARTG